MKRILLPLLLSCLATIFVHADLIWYESFNYPDGPIIVTSTNLDGTPNWFRHSGTGNDAFVRNGREEISATGGILSRSDDVNRPFAISPGSPYTNSQIVTYASFTVNCTNLPNEVGSYFAHFKDTTTSNFVGRVFALVGSAGAGTSPTNFSALPNTWRLGVSGGNAAVNRVFPVDLALNTDYQVVLSYEPVNAFATLWVNPTSSSDLSLSTSDAITSPALLGIIQSAFAFRQGGSFGSFFAAITNLAVATTFDEAATNVWNETPAPPLVVYQPQNTTNFEGAPVIISLVAAGQGLGNLTYQWLKDGSNISNPAGNTNVYSIANLSSPGVGEYRVIVANPTTGLSVTSQMAFVAVDTRTIPPFFVASPRNTTNFFGQTATLTASAAGPQPITYQWTYNGGPITSPNVSGADSPTLTITGVHTNNGTAGNYAVVASNQYGPGTNTSAFVAAIPVPAASIGFLRTQVDPVFFLPTNTTTLYTVTGIVTTHTNITTSGNCSFYMQDDTGGINVFFGGSNARPLAGDSVTVTGPLGQFNSLLELNLTASDPAHSLVINSSGNLLPPGQVLPLSFTNGVGFGGVGESIRKFQGVVVTLTNVYFPLGFAGTNVFASGVNYVMTNQAGETFPMRVDSRVFDIIGQPIPPFAWTVRGPMGFFLGTTATNRSGGYQLLPTRYVDIVTTEPPTPITSVAVSGNNKRTLTWDAVPHNHSYTMLTSTNAAGTYAPQLAFQTTLLGSEEVPPNRSTANGFGSVVLSPDQSTITVNVSFDGLTAPANAGHIHGSAGPGTNASVIFPFTGVPADTSGSIPEQSFVITPAQIGFLTNGLLYMNIHNTNFPGGEIRGQLTAVPSTGLTFATTNGAYVDLNAQNSQKYYRVTSP